MEAHDNLIEMTNNERKSEKGVTTVEYAIMLVMVALVVITFGQGIGGKINTVFSTLQSGLQ